jgi:hypothetical protein
MFARLGRAVVPLASGLVALVLSHSIVYLVRYGSDYGEALAHNGHDGAWTLAVWSTAFLGGTLVVAGAARLATLARAVRRGGLAPADRQVRTDGASWIRSWFVGAIRLAVVVAVLLTIQENAEHLAAGLPLQGPALLLSPEYPFGLAIVAAVSVAVSLVVALYGRRRDALVARLRRAAAAHAAPVRQSARPVRNLLPPPASILGRIGGLRAPPALLAS